jgi:hypothetical protein
MFRLLTALLLALSSIASVVAQPKSVDVAGVSPGMTVTEAKSALKAFNPAFQFAEDIYEARPGIPSSVGKLMACVGDFHPNGATGSFCGAPKKDVPFEEVVVAFGQSNGKAFYVYRAWRPTIATRPLRADILRAVTDKYGPMQGYPRGDKDWTLVIMSKEFPGQIDGNFGSAQYQSDYSRSGKVVPECASNGYLASTGSPPMTASPNCSASVSAKIGWGSPDTVLAHLAIAVYDQRILYDDIQKDKAATDASSAAEKAKSEGAAAKNKAPKL